VRVSARRRKVALSSAWSVIACNSARTDCSRWRSVGIRSRNCSMDMSAFNGRALAVKRVTHNQGKNTPGVDGAHGTC
jgi:hypothetical protein